mmetsp:Transcript_26102/g.48058  ORF Transcript_26102/g.48058 Transcript_26102/m.48058 type:complete len:293 (-) Transcript_26102:177-1055(-)
MNRAVLIFTLIATSKFDGAFSFHQLGAFPNSPHISNNVRAPKLSRAQTPMPMLRPSCRKGRLSTSTTSLFAIPGVSSLITTPAFESVTNNALISPQIITASASAILTYLYLLAAFDRPRGYLTIPDPQNTLLIQPSRVPGAGLGLFAACSIPKGTVLGTYAGVLREAQMFYDGKCRQYPQAVGYSWRFTDNKYVIDPTDSQGEIQDVCLGGNTDVPLSNLVFGTLFRFLSVNTALCRINEPPIGAGGCNVSAKENLAKREVVFELIQNVNSGQELYLDYGLDYDRSRYGPPR